MKKIIFLILLVLTLGGCYDYNELNDLAIVVGMGIDYQDQKYAITFEVLSNNVDKESANTKSFTVTGYDANFATAIDKTSDALPKRAYFSHTDLLALSQNVAKNHIKEIIDYILRNNNIREILNVVVCDNPQELLSNTSKKIAVVSSSINDAITADITSGSYAIEKKYINLVREMISFGEDASATYIAIKKDDIDFLGTALFAGYQMVGTLNDAETAILNVLNNKAKNTLITVNYAGEDFTNSIFKSKINFKVSKNKITVTGEVYGKVLENNPNFDLKDGTTISQIEKTFSYTLNEKIVSLIQKLQSLKSDALYLGENYYINTRDKNDKLWLKAQIEANVEFKISKKGIIYEVYDANK